MPDSLPRTGEAKIRRVEARGAGEGSVGGGDASGGGGGECGGGGEYFQRTREPRDE